MREFRSDALPRSLLTHPPGVRLLFLRHHAATAEVTYAPPYKSVRIGIEGLCTLWNYEIFLKLTINIGFS